MCHGKQGISNKSRMKVKPKLSQHSRKRSTHGEKRFAGLANRIVDIEPTKCFAVPAKF